MQYVAAQEARTRFGELLSLVEGGEQVAITRNGREVAMLIPIQNRRDGFSRLRVIKERLRAEGRLVSMEEALAWRDEGRP